MRILRAHRSRYETDADMAAEAAALAELGSHHHPGPGEDRASGDAEIMIVSSRHSVDAALLEATPSTQLVITTTSGFDHLDLPLLADRGIAACRLPLARRDAVVESTLAMMLWGRRRMGPMQRAAERGEWVRGELPTLAPGRLAGAKVGLVGFGVIGRRMADVLENLGATLLGCDPRGLPDGVHPHTLLELMEKCDILSLHCDLHAGTEGLVSAELLDHARPGLFLVNTARGGLLDLPAALHALEKGRLGGMALDVFPHEPWPGLDSVRQHEDLLCLPHAAGFAPDLAARIREGVTAAVTAHAAGQPLPFALTEG
jgi:D-3-phosphoglycerate dehydrogenase